MKFLLPGGAAVLLAMIFIWPSLSNTAKDISGSIAHTLKPNDVRNLQMVSPQYVGVDNKNRPYRLTAKLATQEKPNADRIKLDSPKGNVTLENGARIALAARSGDYSQKLRRIILNGDVNIFHDDGYTFRTEKAEIDLESGSAHGNQPVRASGPKGTLASQGFKILDKGNLVIFTGKTRIVLKVDKQDMKEVLDDGQSTKGKASEKTGTASSGPGKPAPAATPAGSKAP